MNTNVAAAELPVHGFNTITQAITDNASNALFLMNAEGVCTFLNPAAEQMFGYSLFELGEKPLHDYLHYKHPDGTEFPISDCPIGQSIFSLMNLRDHEDQFIRKDGSFIAVKCSAKAMQQDGLLKGILLEVRDTTEEKRAELALRESEEKYRAIASRMEQLVEERTRELQRSNDDLQQFAHVASHDLKEPVRKILLFATRIRQQGFGDPNSETCLTKIQNAGERLNSMIEGVLRYSSISNSAEQNIGTVDLNTVITEVWEDLELLAKQKGARLQHDALPVIEGAPVLLYQLFYNLLNNSLKFTRQDLQPVISLSSRIEDAFVEVCWSDNGIGFDSVYNEKIFSPFFRLHRKDEFEGTGLGLALCRKIVQRHKGSISALPSEDCKGARFSIRLPRHQASKTI